MTALGSLERAYLCVFLCDPYVGGEVRRFAGHDSGGAFAPIRRRRAAKEPSCSAAPASKSMGVQTSKKSWRPLESDSLIANTAETIDEPINNPATRAARCRYRRLVPTRACTLASSLTSLHISDYYPRRHRTHHSRCEFRRGGTIFITAPDMITTIAPSINGIRNL
jgi:hypothetical protein